ncbi:MAG: SUMF1/EgtB/PvdO family nonheme iron enzyme, partial [Syntrophales bacterium]|nr:SUMF1/EgtB/PvdO family nonheme iron enzyme [Syntrophales bacterium]
PIRCFEPSKPATEAEYPGAFQNDQVLVTNRAFEEFLLDSPEWCPDKVTARYGVPYFLSEFIDGHPPPDKWDHPVVWVSWYAAVAYCNWRSRRAGYRQVYTFEDDHRVVTDLSANGWRLPTEFGHGVKSLLLTIQVGYSGDIYGNMGLH